MKENLYKELSINPLMSLLEQCCERYGGKPEDYLTGSYLNNKLQENRGDALFYQIYQTLSAVISEQGESKAVA